MHPIIYYENKEYWERIDQFLGKIYEKVDNYFSVLAKYLRIKGYESYFGC